MKAHVASPPVYAPERDRWLLECACGWDYEGRSKEDASWAHGYHLEAIADAADRAAELRARGVVERFLYRAAERCERAAWKRTEIRRGNFSGGGW